jgi:hypothetical protein
MEYAIYFGVIIITFIMILMLLRAKDKSSTDQFNNNLYQGFKKEYLRVFFNEDDLVFKDEIISKLSGWEWNEEEFYFENQTQNKKIKMYDIIFDKHSAEFKVYKFKSNK